MKNKLTLTSTTTFYDAIKLLDISGNGVLPVVDTSNNFIGLITDGDIRKAILNKQLDLEHIINKNPYKLSHNTTKQQRLQFLKKIRRRHLPLTDDKGKYIDLFILDDLEFNSKPNHVVIMAGGLGSRLGKLTEHTPKPMLAVGGKPILEAILENFIDHGFNKFYFSVNYKKEIIKEHFENGQKWGVDIQYIEETQKLGTGGALSLISQKLEHPIIVMNGDIMTTLDFDDLLKFHVENNADATMCVVPYDFTLPYGVVESTNDKLISLKEKPSVTININTGIYVLNPEVIQHIPHNTHYDLPILFDELIKNNKEARTYTIKDTWIDIGHIDDYKKINDIFNIDSN